MQSLIEELKKVKDFRKNSGKRHELWLVLLLIILGIMVGYLGYRAMGDFVKTNQQMIVKNFNLSLDRVPSYSTIRRVMMGVDWLNLNQIFNQWASQLNESNEFLNWLAIDGKSLKSTIENCHDTSQNFAVMLSAYCPTSGLVLRGQKFENKESSEIHQVRDLVRDSSFKNKVFTLDALHCQKETIQLIIESNNHYLITVKKNQKTLYKTLEYVFSNQVLLSTHISEDKSHGRQIKRQVSVFKNSELVDLKWSHVQSLIKVERQGKRGQKDYHNIAYYISSLSETAEVFSRKIREHWGIENQLHWVKDVIFQEDNLPIHHFQAVTNFSILQTIALNLFRILGFLSITEGQRWLSYRWPRLLVLLE